jgi:hypothetical protein
MPFHPGWVIPVEGLGYEGYYAGDGHYGHIGHQQDNRILGQGNQIVWFPRKLQQLLVTGVSKKH